MCVQHGRHKDLEFNNTNAIRSEQQLVDCSPTTGSGFLLRLLWASDTEGRVLIQTASQSNCVQLCTVVAVQTTLEGSSNSCKKRDAASLSRAQRCNYKKSLRTKKNHLVSKARTDHSEKLNAVQLSTVAQFGSGLAVPYVLVLNHSIEHLACSKRLVYVVPLMQKMQRTFTCSRLRKHGLVHPPSPAYLMCTVPHAVSFQFIRKYVCVA
jgi:hypothetical protein